MKIRKYLVIILIIQSLPGFSSVETNHLLSEQDQCITNRDEYIKHKQDRINELMQEVIPVLNKNDYDSLYALYDQLYSEYKSFICDSAFNYVDKLNQIAPMLNDRDKLIHAKIEMGFSLLSSGSLKESLDTLLNINTYGYNV